MRRRSCPTARGLAALGRVCQEASSAQAHLGWFLCFEAWTLRLGSSSGRVVLRLNVSFQGPQLVYRLHQTVTVLLECILGGPVPYIIKSSFGKNSYVVSIALFKGKRCNELHSDEMQDKHRMVQDLSTTHGIRMLEKLGGFLT